MKAIYLDLETTGLDCKKAGITQLSGMIEIDGKVVDNFNFYVKPFDKSEIDPEALRVQNKTLEEIIKRGETEESVFFKFLSMLDKYIDKYNRNDKFIVIGYNIRFDIGFLYEFFLRNKNQFLFSYLNSNFLDIPSLLGYLQYENKIGSFSNKRERLNNKLETWSNAFNIQLNAHDSFEDIKATRLLFQKIKKIMEG